MKNQDQRPNDKNYQSIIEGISNKYESALISECAESGCNLNIDVRSNIQILKGESISQAKKMVDCIIFYSDGRMYIYIIELKSHVKNTDDNRYKIPDIKEKFENSVSQAVNIFNLYKKDNDKYKLCLILLSEHLKSNELVYWKNIGINVQNKKYNIICMDCKKDSKSVPVSLTDLIKRCSRKLTQTPQ